MLFKSEHDSQFRRRKKARTCRNKDKMFFFIVATISIIHIVIIGNYLQNSDTTVSAIKENDARQKDAETQVETSLEELKNDIRKNKLSDESTMKNYQNSSTIEEEQQQQDKVPKVIIAGTQKGGTEALQLYLSKHPQMLQSRDYETHFFDRFCTNCKKLFKYPSKPNANQIYYTRQEYKTYWDPIQQRNPALLAFEKTPVYMFDPTMPKLIHTIVPWTKIIIILRDPIERAYSEYKMNKYRVSARDHVPSEQKKIEQHTFSICVDEDIKKLQKAKIISSDFLDIDRDEQDKRWLEYWDSLNITQKERFTSKDICSMGEIGRGIYYIQLQQWFNEFSPDRILILQTETFLSSGMRNGTNVMKNITDFLGITEMELSQPTEKIHSTPDDTQMERGIRKTLQEIYDPFNKILASILGSEWKDPWPYNL